MTAGERTGSGSAMYSVDVGEHERDTGIEPGGDGVGVGDGARVGSGACCVTAMGRMGQTGCEGTEWESETSVRSQSGPPQTYTASDSKLYQSWEYSLGLTL
jgi:hypothetical protein